MEDLTVVLVHGALTDASVWTEVIRCLHTAGHNVLAPALPMRGLDSDAEYLATLVDRLGPPVLLVAHSYAGAVISHPALVRTETVRGLVFVAAFQPDEGEAAGALNERFPGSLLTPENLVVTSNPLGGEDLALRPDRFAEVYAADVEPRVAAVMSVSQRPMEPAALGEPLPGEPTWRTLPSWAVVSTNDRLLPPETLRFMAQRAGSRIREIASLTPFPSHNPRPSPT